MSSVIIAGNTSGTITLDAPNVAGTTTLTLPATTDTLVGKTTTDTLTNKTLTSPVIGGTPTGVGILTSGTSVASTSGTSIDFTSIPSWVKRITVMFSGVSTSGTSIVQIQLGSSSFATSGYLSGSQFSTSTYQSTTGLALPFAGGTDVRYGSVIITNVNGNLWNAINAMYTTGNAAGCGGGSVTLSGTLDRIRITTVNGTDTFDAGTINILYE